MSTTALLLALGAAFAGAMAAVLQNRGVNALRTAQGGVATTARALVRDPVWLSGLAMAGVSGLLHALALHHGSIIEVESIMVTSLLFALVLGATIGRARVTRRDWIGALLTVVGLAAFLGFADPQDGSTSIAARTWVLGGVVLIALVAGLVLLARRARTPAHRAALFATGAATCLGTAAVLLKMLTIGLDDHDTGRWGRIGALLVALGLFELGALVLQQVAFRCGVLAAALGPFVGGNPLIAGAIGVVVLDERFHHALGDLVAASIGLALVVAGISVLASSHAVAAGSEGGGERPVH